MRERLPRFLESRLAAAGKLAALLALLGGGCVRLGFAPPPLADGSRADGTAGDLAACPFTVQREITIRGSATRLQQAQVMISLPHPAQLQPDCRDLRVVAPNEATSLPHWTAACTSGEVRVWALVPEIPVAGTTVRLIYGSTCATEASSYAATFPWQRELVDPGSSYQHFAVAIDKSSRLQVSYRDETNGDLKYARYDGSWSVQTIDSAGDTGFHTSIVVDSADRPQISYFDRTTARLRYARWTGSAWEPVTAVETTDGDLGYTSLALDGSGEPHISYAHGAQRRLRHAFRQGVTWTSELVDGTANTASTSLRIDSQGHLHIAYQHVAAPYELRYAEKTTSWQLSTLASGADYVTLAIDAEDRPHIAYYELEKALRYAWREGTTWHNEMIKALSHQAFFLGLQFDGQGLPHVSFQDYASNNALGYATKRSGSWTTELVDTEGNTGNDSALALDSEGFPHIVYGTEGQGFKHAYRRVLAFPPCTVTVGAEQPLAQ